MFAFVLTIPLANWMIGNVGTVCPPDGPCLIPVAPGLLAPSGVLVAGLAFVLRDLVQRRLGLAWAIKAIVLGGLISAAVSPPALVVASSMVGLVVDTSIFLQLAFGSTDLMWGQIVGKGWMVLFAIPLIHLLRVHDARRIAPATAAQI